MTKYVLFSDVVMTIVANLVPFGKNPDVFWILCLQDGKDMAQIG